MNIAAITEFVSACRTAGIEVPAPITRGLEQIAIARSCETAPSGTLLDLTDDEVRERITDLSIRTHQGNAVSSRGMVAGIETFIDELLAEIRTATLPYLDSIIADMRPRFDETAAPLVTAAQQYGFTFGTTSDEVIDLADEAASAAWRDARTAWHAIAPLARFRTSLSALFDVSPTRDDIASEVFAYDESLQPVDYSICFAAGDNWAYDGAYYLNRKTAGSIDWFALAAGGLHLNTPAEVRALQETRFGIVHHQDD